MYDLTEEEQKEVYKISIKVVERINQIQLVEITKELLKAVDKLKELPTRV